MGSTSASALRLSSMVSVSPNCNCSSMTLMKKTAMAMAMAPFSLAMKIKSKRGGIRCEVAINAVDESTTSPEAKIGARVKVKAGVKVYHVPKVAELDLTGLEGEIKQYVGLWNGKRISANLPYKVQFLTDIPGRGPVKFFAHLKEDEFDYL